ncbi:MAG: sulfur oxidation protein SoxY, partial [Mesorhizobium sp.]
MREDPLRVHGGLVGRRQFLRAGMTGLLVISLPRWAVARPSLDEAIRTFTGGADVLDGRVRLDLPPLVENGNAVGITVAAESPMTADDHVRR